MKELVKPVKMSEAEKLVEALSEGNCSGYCSSYSGCSGNCYGTYDDTASEDDILF